MTVTLMLVFESGYCSGQPRRDFFHLGQRLFDRDTRLESAPAEQPGMIVAHLPNVVVRSPGQREPDFRGPRREHLRRHHADDGVGLVAEVHRASEHIWIARKKPSPEAVADQADHRPAHAIFFLGKDAPQLRGEPDHLEEVRRHQAAGDLFRRPSFEAAQVKRFATRDREMLEGGVVAPPIEVIRIRNRRSAAGSCSSR